jgi:polar amino acid transport system substrate-binding protein
MWMKGCFRMRCLFALVAMGSLLYAQTVKFSVGEWEPYVSEQLEGYGVVARIVDIACKRAGLKCVYEFHPWQRSFDMAVRNYEGTMGTFPWAYRENRTQKMLFNTIPILQTNQVVFFRKGVFSPNTNLSLRDLRGKKVVAIRSYIDTAQLLDANVSPHIVGTEETAWKMIATGRMNIMVASEYVGRSGCNRYAPKVCSQLAISKPHDTHKLGIYFTRIHDDSLKIMKKIDTELMKMKQTGEIKKIYQTEFGI